MRFPVLKAATLAGAHLALTLLVEHGWGFGKYPRLAAGLVAGALSPAQVGDASPAYLALNVWLAPQVLRVFQALVAAGTVALLFMSLSRRVGERAAWVAGAALACAQPWLVYSAVLEPDLLIGAAAVTALLSATHERRGVSALGAVAAGFAAALRPTQLGVVVLLAIAIARQQSWRRAALFVTVSVVVMLTPQAILRRWSAPDARTTMSVGQVFHQSHRPESQGAGAVFPSLLKVVEAQASTEPHPPDHAHQLYRDLARAASGEPDLTDAQTEWWWVTRSLRLFTAEPRWALEHLAQKVIAYLAPWSRDYDIPWVRPRLAQSSGWTLPLRVLMLGAAMALTLLMLARARSEVLSLGWLAGLATAVLFYSQGRYLVTVVPTACALLGVASVRLAWRPRSLVALWPLVLLALPQVRWSDRFAERLDVLAVGERASDTDLRARYLTEQAAMPDVLWLTVPRALGVGADDPQTQRHAAELAEAQYGTQSPVDATLAAALWQAAGDCPRALALAVPAGESGFSIALADLAVDPHLIASDCLLAQGRRVEALAHLEAANRTAPLRLEVLARLVAAGDTGAATSPEHWEERLLQVHDAVSAHLALARARRAWGDPQGARVDAAWVATHWPEAAPFAAWEEARCWLDEHREPEALEAYERALVLHASLHGEHLFDGLMNRAVPGIAERHWRRRGVRPGEER